MSIVSPVTGEAVWVPETVPAILERAVRERRDDVALVSVDCELTYAQYGAAVTRLAHRLARHGTRGDTVAIVLPNMAATAIAIFAAQSAGMVAATLNPDYTAAELAPMIEDAAPACTIVSSEVHQRIAGLLGETETILITSDSAFLAELAKEPEDSSPLPAPSPDDLAVLQFTGGSTGRPKGVELTHRAVATNIAQREAVLPTQFGDERVLGFMPMFHSFAAAMCVNFAAYAAGKLVILPRYRPDWVVEALQRHAITRLPAGPTVFNSLIQYDGLSREATASLRCAYSGSAPLGVETLARWDALTGVPVFEGYGQSEAGPILTYFGPGMTVKPGSVGPPLPGTQIRIVDPADPTRDLATGEAGEILARGPQVMRGYRALAEETAETLRGGWLHTGDIGTLDADGVLTIADRKKDMVLISGYNVFPREVDEALLAHPDIAAAACVGVPDSYRGERLVAFVTPGEGCESDAQGLSEWLAERLVRYKRPAEYRVLGALPLTAAGKIDKQALKRAALEPAGEARHVA
jgi:long-chain acyl-CoA synthetase